MEVKKQAIKTAVVACIVDADDRVLLARRKVEPFGGQWVMPGGKIDHGEALAAALHREVREEVGIEIRLDGLFDVFEHIGVGNNDDHFVIIYYRAHPESLLLTADGIECSEARWVASEDLADYDLPPGTRHILGRIYPGLDRRLRLRDYTPEEEIPGFDRNKIEN